MQIYYEVSNNDKRTILSTIEEEEFSTNILYKMTSSAVL